MGASYNLILEHILSYSGTYELPLRTMYTINATPRGQMSRPTTPTGNNKISTSPPGPTEAQLASADLQSSLLTQISKQRSQPCYLPPTFITNFLRKCFPYELELVDFPQALTALDYLKDLDVRRKRELAASLQRLGVKKESFQHNTEGLGIRDARIATFVNNQLEGERKIESYYARLYVAIRRWILINELSLQPFLKHNCLAMLNTLYPPIAPEQDFSAQHTVPHLSPDVLEQQRKGFFEWIGQVEKHGREILAPLMQVGCKSGEKNGWPHVRACLDDYLRLANMVIEECQAVGSVNDLDEFGLRRSNSSNRSKQSRGTRKADSGVSFTGKERSSASGNRPSTTSGRPSTSSSDKNKTLPAQPFIIPSRPDVSYDIGRAKVGGSALEKIAREFRRVRPQLSPTTSKENAQRSSNEQAANNRRETDDGPQSPREAAQERSGRGRSRSNVFTRSMSRMRGQSKSRSRPSTATGVRPADEDVPPTPSLPPNGFKSAFEDDDDDDDERSSRNRFKRSLSLSRARSSSRSGGMLRKMKSLGENKTREHLVGSDESFETQSMRMKREAWQASERSQPSIGAAM